MIEPTYDIRYGDCIPGMAELEPDSIQLCVTSIPFGALFSYSGKTEDLGNNADGVDMRGSEFGCHLRFAIAQLIRILEPGAIAAIHIQQLRATKVQHGYMGRRDFRGAVVDLFGAGGFDYQGDVVIPKNPQVMAQRSRLHSLQFITGKERDGRRLTPAPNDYLMIFAKPGEGGTPVRCIYDADTNPAGWVTTEEWIRWARGSWEDIRETDVVEGWQDVREEGDERHVCCLQLEVIRRSVKLWSNPGATVLDQFMGVGSVAAIAIEQGRNAIGFEIKESYHKKALRVAELALEKRRQDQVELPLFPDWEEKTA